ncbi:hypothetical protein [Streptomyces sp. NPDC085540]
MAPVTEAVAGIWDWQRSFPEAESVLAAGLVEEAGARLLKG